MCLSLDRRRFLKYAGATATVVGVSALSLDYLRLRSSITSTSSTQSSTAQSTTLTSTTGSSSKSGLVFRGKHWYGYNLDGIQSEASYEHVTILLVI
jgi:hypothetical protein